MSFARGYAVVGREQGTLEVVAGERADVPRRLYIKEATARRARAMAYYAARLDGRTDAEIGLLWCRSRQYINRQINGLSDAARAEVRANRLRARRAELLLIEDERGEAY